MYCPRCGHRNEKDARFCANCAATLTGTAPAATSRSLGERLVALVGHTRRERLATAGTLLAVAVAIVAYLALRPADDDVPRDEYTLAAEEICVDAETQLREAAEGSAGDLRQYAAEIVLVTADWLSQFKGLPAPADRAALAAALQRALVGVTIEAGALARVSREGTDDEAVAQAGRVDAASAGVEAAIADLRLDACDELTVAPGSTG